MQKHKLYLEDIFPLDTNKTRIKFNLKNEKGEDPLLLWLKDHQTIDNSWLFWEKNKSHLSVGDTILCLINMQNDRWLLSTIKQVTHILPKFNAPHYKGKVLEKYRPFFGRLVLRFHNNAQQIHRKFGTLKRQLEVHELLPEEYNGKDFPGYENIFLSWDELKQIVDTKKSDWLHALQNRKGVYRIMDLATGKVYIGAAYGKEGLWQRLAQYTKNGGHGGNKKLKELGFDYIKKNFEYRVLVSFPSIVSDEEIIAQEKWWKEVFKSMAFGYNDN